MRWRGSGRSDDVIDVRGGGGGRGGGIPLPIGAGGGLGVVGVIIYLAISLLGGGSGGAFSVPGFDGSGAPAQGQPIPESQDPDLNLKKFSSYVFTDVQDTWTKIFQAQGRSYTRAKLVLYSGATQTGCGLGQAAAGPFYCPADERVYLDLSFYREMQNHLRAGGDFAWAYVIGHELGHHVQKLLGTEAKVQQLRRDDPSNANPLSVRLELQADCYAGVWAHAVYQEGQLDPGDVEEAMTASQAVGDDRLQKQAGQRVNPDSFTHGSSAQRLKWFETGRKNGEPADCDTFSVDSP